MSVTTLVVWAGVVAFIGLVLWRDRRHVPKGRAPWTVWPTDERDLPAIRRYVRRPAGPGSDRVLDDRTWTDLNMDDVFRVLDRAESLVGQQVLYCRLRSVPCGDHLDAFERLVTRCESDENARVRAQTALRRMRHVDGHDLQWLAEPGSFEEEPWHVIFPIIGATMLVTALLASVYPAAVLVLAAGSIAALVLRSTAAKHLRIAAGAFRQVEPVLAAADALRLVAAPETAPITSPVGGDIDALASLRRVAKWAGRDPTGAMAGELGQVVLEYLNLVLALDGNALYFGARQLRAHGDALLRVVHAVGEIDAALSIASYRRAVPGWSRPMFEATGPASFDGLRHPLLPDAVASTIRLAPPHGVVITGSNMSGKTTFLRTLGVNVVLAQTVHTCVADHYQAPVLVVRSCIGRADDPASGKSYYLMEVEAVLGLVHASRLRPPHLFLFDELFRGTNTVERIAAGEAVLAALVADLPDGQPTPHIVVAATHDQELVDLLGGRYESFHFSDRVGDDGLEFDYQLRTGPALTRNAIALLRLRGAPPDLVALATARANALDAARDTRASPTARR